MVLSRNVKLNASSVLNITFFKISIFHQFPKKTNQTTKKKNPQTTTITINKVLE